MTVKFTKHYAILQAVTVNKFPEDHLNNALFL